MSGCIDVRCTHDVCCLPYIRLSLSLYIYICIYIYTTCQIMLIITFTLHCLCVGPRRGFLCPHFCLLVTVRSTRGEGQGWQGPCQRLAGFGKSFSHRDIITTTPTRESLTPVITHLITKSPDPGRQSISRKTSKTLMRLCHSNIPACKADAPQEHLMLLRAV